MKALPIVLILIILGVIAYFYIANSAPSQPVTLIKKTTDTLVIVRDSIINANSFDTIPTGFYQGMLPCKNCEGIQRTILFADNEHFKMEELNWGKATPAKRTEGTWEKEKGKFLLYENSKLIGAYRLSKDSLINIENNGARIPDSLSHQYVLFRKNRAPENSSWKKRRSEGVGIIGTGNEPFWSLEIDKEKFILFKWAGAPRPVIVPIEKPVVTKDSTVYAITTEAGNLLKISIAPGFCSDGLSDHIYEYKMNVTYKGQFYKGGALFLDK
ncbi:copper resistance protein NlpE N-terminal domain-containing protein [Flavitalea flava]